MPEQDITLQTYPVRLRGGGQITIPQAIRERLAFNDGDFLVMVEVDGMVFLAPKPLQAPRLADRLADMMDEAGATLADLLQGIEGERIAIWQERNC